jgi:aerobic carbon-monoxide dehydrogenase small subunit
MTDAPIEFTLNGEARRFQVAPHRSLLDVLYHDLGLTGTREGCRVGVCGACTVLVDGTPQSACLLFGFQAEGRTIVTIEGLRKEDELLDRVQQAFAEATAFQCSYCTPGFVMVTHGLLREHPQFDESVAREYLSGNLCRCGSYVKILKAVLSLAQKK